MAQQYDFSGDSGCLTLAILIGDDVQQRPHWF